MIYFWIFFLFLLMQRSVELVTAKRHERILKKSGGVEVDRWGYRLLVLMHGAFLISFLAEKTLLDRRPSPAWEILLAIFLVAQILRYWAIVSLEVYWNTKIIVVPEHPLIKRGPYKVFRHPNYAAVVVEIAVIPLLFSCVITALVFTIINAMLLVRRISAETKALANLDK